MFSEVIVPVDGSAESARALGPAGIVAKSLEIPLRIVSYHAARDEGFDLRRVIKEQLTSLGPVRRTIETAVAVKPVAEHIVDVLDHANGALVVMSTHGHGRSMALVGSVATTVLERSRRPALLIGPAFEPDSFRVDGPMIVAVGGPVDATEPTLDLAAQFAAAFDHHPWIVEVVDPEAAAVLASARSGAAGSDLPFETAGAHRAANALRSRVGREVDYEVVHDEHPGKALADFAERLDAALLVMATTAGHGVHRLIHGSQTADAVRTATCPVLAVAVEQ